ncbi:MAG: hypothetical protein WA958_02705 [Tunicatimonas sp.]
MARIAGILKDFFATYQQKVTQATASGRLDVMGGITDVAGSLLLQRALAPVATAYVANRDDQSVTLKIVHQGTATHDIVCSYPELIGSFPTVQYDYIRQQVRNVHPDPLVMVLLGCLVVLFAERKLKFEGLAVVLVSDLPWEAGVGAFAALEMALLKAVSNSLNLTVAPYELPLAAHHAENWVGGFSTGPSRHLVASLGDLQQLTPLRCQPAEVFHPIPLPDTLSFVGLGTGGAVRLDDPAPARLRVAMFMGYSIVALADGATVRDLEVAKETGDWSALPYGGYLGNIPPSEFEDKYLSLLPEGLTGQDFVEKFRTSIDVVSFIDRDEEYPVRKAARLAVYENFRAQLFVQVVKNYSPEFQNYANRLTLMGELMYQSHQSYTDCGIGYPGADDIVARVKAAGPRKGLYGARITAPGSGGMVCILCGGLSGYDNVVAIQQAYEQQLGKPVALFQ